MAEWTFQPKRCTLRVDGLPAAGQLREPAKFRLGWCEYAETGEEVRCGEDRYTRPDTTFRAAAARAARQMTKRCALPCGRNLFIRYGSLPRSGLSKNWTTGVKESGTSVYRAVLDPRTCCYAPGGASPGTLVHMIFERRRPALVTGEVVGRGSDNEPVIRRARRLAALRYDARCGGLRQIGGRR